MVALGALLAAPVTLAREEGAPASALGTADAVRATSVGTAGLYFNPAGMGLVSQYAIEAGYTYSGNLDAHAVGAAAVDSKTNQMIAMGVGYAFLLGEEDGHSRDGHQIRGGFASGWESEDFGFHLGAVGRYFTLNRQGLSDSEFFTLDVGVILEIMQMFRIGVVGTSLIDTKTEEAPRQVGVGGAFTYGAFQASFDVNMDIQTDPESLFPEYGAGAQYLIENIFVVRAGFSMGGIEEHKTLALGAGYVSTALAADVSFSKRTDIAGGAVVSLAVRYFMP